MGLIYPDLSDIEKVSSLQSKMTHYDERCNQTCEIYNRIVWKLLHGENLTEAVQREVISTEYKDILDGVPDCEPSGFVVHTFRHVLHILLTSDSFSDVVEQAANLGGDSDTIGAIAGGLAGAHYGYEGIPERYSSVILIKDKLDSLSEQIIESRNRLA
ncbi:ADP-ribosyl-[dinitrogen reductase] glycohydrolase [compost metagenome]